MIAQVETATGRVLRVCGDNEALPAGAHEIEASPGLLELAAQGVPILIVDGEPVEDLTCWWRDLRLERNARLVPTDHWERPSVVAQTEPALFEARMTYCQALRDLPENTVDPRTPDWPIPPE